MTKRLIKDTSRFEPSGLNDRFLCENESFSEYVLQTREMIEKVRVDLPEEGSEAEKIVDANSPYEWLPRSPEAKNPETGRYCCGVLFIHGLFDSPFVFDSIAKKFMEKNYLIRAILLPGHGTIPGDLQNIHYQEWAKATKFGIQSFDGQVDQLFVAGFSTGGVLALIHAYTYPIAGLLLFAPAVKMRTQFAVVSSINNFMTRTIGGITWYIKADDTDYAKYQSVTLEPAHQVYQLTRELQNLHESKILDTPLFIVCTSDDEAISETGIIQYFSLLPNPKNRLVYYTTNFFPTDDPRIIQISSQIPEKNIISFSHVCLPIAPWHSHYGENGDFVDYEHYAKLYGRGGIPKETGQQEVLGAVSRENLKKYNLKRLTYNPDFNNMMNLIEDFMYRVNQAGNTNLDSAPYVFRDNLID